MIDNKGFNMRKFILCKVFLLIIPISALGVDFSSSSVVTEASGTDTVRIRGIEDAGQFFTVDLRLTADSRLELASSPQISQDNNIALERELRNTTWIGTYTINNKVYNTSLTFSLVQNNDIIGEIRHEELPEEGDNFLEVRVIGTIVTQFEITKDFIAANEALNSDNISPGFVDADNLPTDIRQILEADPAVGSRQLIRARRARAINLKQDTRAPWQSNREYRLTLARDEDLGTASGNLLEGSVGIPTVYTLNSTTGVSDSSTTDNGKLLLFKN